MHRAASTLKPHPVPAFTAKIFQSRDEKRGPVLTSRGEALMHNLSRATDGRRSSDGMPISNRRSIHFVYPAGSVHGEMD